MHGLKMQHVDDFTLLRYVAQDLDDAEREAAALHIEDCATCQKTLAEIQELDQELSAIAKDPDASRDFELDDLPQGDPFRRRPSSTGIRSRWIEDGTDLAVRTVLASEEGAALSTVIVDAAKSSSQDFDDVLGRLDLSDPAHRFGLFYSLQEGGKQIAENPTRLLLFGERCLQRVGEAVTKSEPDGLSNEISLASLLAQAHQLVGQACLWTADFEKAGLHFALAYRSFAHGSGDVPSLATIEQLESQRRSFTGRPQEAYVLARRAACTFEELGMEDSLARAKNAEGLALARLERREEAVATYRSAALIFERHQIWTNYVVAVNCVGVSLAKLGRLDEARREYARALRRISPQQDRALVASVRHSLAEVLFSAGKYRDAAVSVARAIRLYERCGLTVAAIKAALFEVESWARSGDMSRALHRLDLFRATVAHHRVLDPSVAREIAQALSGSHPDFERVADLRQRTDEVLAERLGASSA